MPAHKARRLCPAAAGTNRQQIQQKQKKQRVNHDQGNGYIRWHNSSFLKAGGAGNRAACLQIF
jgi:hypothetical protein